MKDMKEKELLERATESVQDLPISSLETGKYQTRTGRGVGKDLPRLTRSIDKWGLMHPILVCLGSKEGKYEIIAGQRRYLAHKELQKETIRAFVIEERLDIETGKGLSLAENISRLDLPSNNIRNTMVMLYGRYGSTKAVAEEMALPYDAVSRWLKWETIKESLKESVDKGEIDVDLAHRVQDCIEARGEFVPEDEDKIKVEMQTMSNAQRDQVKKEIEEDPTGDLDEIFERAKRGAKIASVTIRMTASTHKALKNYAKDEGISKITDAADTLINRGLEGGGYLEED